MFIFLDTETTGLEGTDKIIQLSYIITDRKCNILDAKNYFFDVDVEISKGATEVHGIDKEKLIELSGGKKFKDYAKDILWDFQNAKVICHNVKFDTNMLKYEFARLHKKLQLRDTFCTMEGYTDILKLWHEYYGYKWPKLEEVVEYLNLDREDLKVKSTEVFKEEVADFHDARLDVYTTYRIYKALKESVMSEHIEKVKEKVNNLTTETSRKDIRSIIRELEECKSISNLFGRFEDKIEEPNFQPPSSEQNGFEEIDDDDIPF